MMLEIKEAGATTPATENRDATRQTLNLCPQYITSYKQKSITPIKLVDHAKAGMAAADLAGDVDAWVEHFTTYCKLWPAAFADAMEAAS